MKIWKSRSYNFILMKIYHDTITYVKTSFVFCIRWIKLLHILLCCVNFKVEAFFKFHIFIIVFLDKLCVQYTFICADIISRYNCQFHILYSTRYPLHSVAFCSFSFFISRRWEKLSLGNKFLSLCCNEMSAYHNFVRL